MSTVSHFPTFVVFSVVFTGLLGNLGEFAFSGTSVTLTKSVSSPAASQPVKESGAGSVEMASPTSDGGSGPSQTQTATAFNFSAAPPSFNFLSNSVSSATSTSGYVCFLLKSVADYSLTRFRTFYEKILLSQKNLSSSLFGSVGSSSSVTAPTFAFGSTVVDPAKSVNQSAAVTSPPLTNVFTAPAAVPLPPSTFNFGGTASNTSNPFGELPQSTFNFSAPTGE